MESLSSFAKRFIAQVTKPDVDFVFGLSPVISIEQKTLACSRTSTAYGLQAVLPLLVWRAAQAVMAGLACLFLLLLLRLALGSRWTAVALFVAGGGALAGLFIFFPVTGDLGAWYAGAGVTALLVFTALSLFGFTTALAGRSAPGRSDAFGTHGPA